MMGRLQWMLLLYFPLHLLDRHAQFQLQLYVLDGLLRNLKQYLHCWLLLFGNYGLLLFSISISAF